MQCGVIVAIVHMDADEHARCSTFHCSVSRVITATDDPGGSQELAQRGHEVAWLLDFAAPLPSLFSLINMTSRKCDLPGQSHPLACRWLLARFINPYVS